MNTLSLISSFLVPLPVCPTLSDPARSTSMREDLVLSPAIPSADGASTLTMKMEWERLDCMLSRCDAIFRLPTPRENLNSMSSGVSQSKTDIPSR